MTREEIVAEIKKLETVPKTKEALQARGLQFETLVIQLLEDEGILLKKPYHTSDNRAEQIDGAIGVSERVFLIEIKWVESGLAASDFYAFLGKVDNKLSGTLGIFISMTELTENFVNSIAKGRQRKVVLIHGQDTQKLIALPKNEIRAYIEQAIIIYSVDNEKEFKVDDFVKLKYQQAQLKRSEEESTDTIRKLVGLITDEKAFNEYLLFEGFNKSSDEDQVSVFKFLLQNWARYYETSSDAFSRGAIFRNILKSLQYFRILGKEKVIKAYFAQFLSSPDISLILPELYKFFGPHLAKLSTQEQQAFGAACLQLMNLHRGQYHQENMITAIVTENWQMFSETTKIGLLQHYFDFYFSDRKSRYEQKSFSIEIVKHWKDSLTKQAAAIWINDKIAEDLKDIDQEKIDYHVCDTASDYFLRHYDEMRFVLDQSSDEFRTTIRNMYRAFCKK